MHVRALYVQVEFVGKYFPINDLYVGEGGNPPPHSKCLGKSWHTRDFVVLRDQMPQRSSALFRGDGEAAEPVPAYKSSPDPYMPGINLQGIPAIFIGHMRYMSGYGTLYVRQPSRVCPLYL